MRIDRHESSRSQLPTLDQRLPHGDPFFDIMRVFSQQCADFRMSTAGHAGDPTRNFGTFLAEAALPDLQRALIGWLTSKSDAFMKTHAAEVLMILDSQGIPPTLVPEILKRSGYAPAACQAGLALGQVELTALPLSATVGILASAPYTELLFAALRRMPLSLAQTDALLRREESEAAKEGQTLDPAELARVAACRLLKRGFGFTDEALQHLIVDRTTATAAVQEYGQQIMRQAGQREAPLFQRTTDQLAVSPEQMIVLCAQGQAFLETDLRNAFARNQAIVAANADTIHEQRRLDLMEKLAKCGMSIQLQTLILTVHDGSFYFTLPGSDALAVWRDLHSARDGLGYWPVIIGDADGAHGDLRQVRENLLHYGLDIDPSTAIAESNASSGARRLAAMLDDLSDLDEAWAENDDNSPHIFTSIDAHLLTYEDPPIPHGRVAIALIPTTKGHEVAAYLRFGGFNGCPDTATHVAVLRHFEERYGAQVVAMNNDSIQLEVQAPPPSAHAAEALALEHYCYDEITQRAQRASYTAGLRTAKTWRFWWD